MARAVSVLLLLVAAAAAVNAVHLDFAKGLDGWTHAGDSKYNGVFEVETLHGLDWAGLKVSSADARPDHGCPARVLCTTALALCTDHAIARAPDHPSLCGMGALEPSSSITTITSGPLPPPLAHPGFTITPPPSPPPPCVPRLQVTEKAKHYGISKVLSEPVDPAEGLVLQYDLKFTAGHTCAGAYIKFLTHTKAAFTPTGLKDNTPYTVMFGPDKCGATNKVRGRAGWLERLPAAAHRSADE